MIPLFPVLAWLISPVGRVLSYTGLAVALVGGAYLYGHHVGYAGEHEACKVRFAQAVAEQQKKNAAIDAQIEAERKAYDAAAEKSRADIATLLITEADLQAQVSAYESTLAANPSAACALSPVDVQKMK